VGIGRRHEALEDLGLGVLPQGHDGAGEGGAAGTGDPVLDDDRVLDDHAVGDGDQRATGHEGVVEQREGVGAAVDAGAEGGWSLGQGGDVGHDQPLGGVALVEVDPHDGPVEDPDGGGPVDGRRQERAGAPAGGRLVPVEVELVDPAVAPRLFGRCRQGRGREPLGGGQPPFGQPVGAAQGARLFSREIAHGPPTWRPVRSRSVPAWYRPTTRRILPSTARSVATARWRIPSGAS
jgi:hypothetical protein